MLRVRTMTALAVGALILGACGSSSPTKPAGGGDTTTTMGDHGMDHSSGSHDATTTTMGDHGMDHSHAGGSHDDPGKVQIAKPLAVLADGTIDPAKIDLGGVSGVTAGEQAKAEKLLKDTIVTLPKWNNYDTAIKDGFESIGDGLTGEEHVIHWDWIDDDTIFDPTHPESLVYRVTRDDKGVETKTLEAAMFLMPKSYNLENEPKLGGKLMQYHIHDNLCFTPPPSPKVAGLTTGDGKCNAPLVKFNPNIMVHVWIRPNECGPFAALLGVGAGQTKSGDRACDHDHGRLSL